MTAERLNLTDIESEVRVKLDSMYEARELVLKLSRPIIRTSANAIRALHRGENDIARELMDEARAMVVESVEGLGEQGVVYHAQILDDADSEEDVQPGVTQELVEAPL